MDFVVFYFSGTGNTKWTAESLSEVLERHGHASSLFSIDGFKDTMSDEALSSCEKADFIGLAQPIYGADIPKTMRRFTSLLIDSSAPKPAKPQKVFFVNTFGYVNGFGWFEAKKPFKNTGYKAAAYINLRLSNTAPQKGRTSLPVGAGLPDKVKAAANKKMERAVDKITADGKYVNGIGPHILIGKIMRKALGPALDANYLKMHVDSSVCSTCMQCVDNCPTGGIEYYDGAFAFNDACQACMRCVNLCPEKAVSN